MDNFNKDAFFSQNLEIPIPEFDSISTPLQMKNKSSSLNMFWIESEKNGLSIPSFPCIGNVPKISGNTLSDILSGKYDNEFDDLYIVDCRYTYEYDGGHIKGAVNANSIDELQKMFFDNIVENAVIVFHCEFSHNRGPQLASSFRDIDRNMNKKRYPQLFYPNVFILDGGYCNFYRSHSEWCDGGYTPMLDDEHRINGDLIKATKEFRKNMEKIENHYKPAKIMHDQISYEFLKSPKPWGANYQSPISGKMLSFLSSPVKQPRKMRPDP